MTTRRANNSDHDPRSRPARQERTMEDKTVSAAVGVAFLEVALDLGYAVGHVCHADNRHPRALAKA